ncbi:hypothetical protein SAMN02745244_02678 [Tessaracoccus bendigoensis DSM 12906]|uniref:Uncharacterized protein n=1 Tax=Tessaracoccus bendigoensis DSM 12906 TaxID=1123357 RepID=A0A1M6JXT0_9ACTN|nr:hypothetical protein SAMN02745244_02678 [Tessaracoccus bendigoensis DSM 12906]
MSSTPAVGLVTSDPPSIPVEGLVTSGIRQVSSDTAGMGHKSLVSTTITTTRQVDGRSRQASPAPARHQRKGSTPAFRRRYLWKGSSPAGYGRCPAILLVSATDRWCPRRSTAPASSRETRRGDTRSPAACSSPAIRRRYLR